MLLRLKLRNIFKVGDSLSVCFTIPIFYDGLIDIACKLVDEATS